MLVRLRIYLLPCVVAAFATWFVYSRGADFNYDLLNYHFFMGYSVLTGRAPADVWPADIQGFLNPYWNVVSYLANNALPFPWNAWALLSIQLLSLPALIGLVRELEISFRLPRASIEGMIAFALCVISPLWLSELGTSFFSSSTTPFLLFALWLAVRAVSKRPRPAPPTAMFFAGCLIGLATGFKLTNAMFLIALPFALVPLIASAGIIRVVRLGALYAVGALIGFALTARWNIYLWTEWQSPLYPFFNKIFQSPYFDLVNFRDGRWVFTSLTDFLRFVSEACCRTQKTSEFAFSDIRIPITLLLAVAALLAATLRLARPNKQKENEPVNSAPAAILWIASVAFIFWTLALAYQRYFIPLELVAGLVIWILMRSLLRSSAVIPSMLLIALTSILTIPILDWGHVKRVRGSGLARFELQMPAELRSSPAIYLLTGERDSYVLPFLHPESHFLRLSKDMSGYYGGGVRAAIAGKMRAVMAKAKDLPVRLMTQERYAPRLVSVAKQFDLPGPDEAPWRCLHFLSTYDHHVSCEIADRGVGDRKIGTLTASGIDFRAQHPPPPELLWITGLSVDEEWGRWSDSDAVVVSFGQCLPRGIVQMKIEGRAFGPNVGRPIEVSIGASVAEVSLGADIGSASLRIANNAGCERDLTFKVPRKTSPNELGQNGDTRQLGIGFVRLDIYAPEQPPR